MHSSMLYWAYCDSTDFIFKYNEYIRLKSRLNLPDHAYINIPRIITGKQRVKSFFIISYS